jgi:hypothetical protein
MSIGSNPNLIASVGSVQQKNAMVAYNRSVTRSELKIPVPKEVGGSQAAMDRQDAASVQDSASISRAAIAALESSKALSDETIIRDEREAALALAYTREQIMQQTDEALKAHRNQTSLQVLELYGR